MSKIISHLLNFLLIICIFILSISIIFKFTILKKEYILKTLKTTNYYQEIYKIIENTIENNLISSGLDENIIKSLITKDIVTKDINNIIDSFYDQKDFILSSANIRANFNQQIKSVLNNNFHQLTNEERKNITELENKVIEIYESEITIFSTKITIIPTIINMVNKLINIVIIIISLIILNILAINVVFLKNSLKNISISFLASGLIFLIIKLLTSFKFQNLLLFNKAISNLILFIIQSIFNYILGIGIILTIIGISLIIIASKNNQK